MNEHGNRLILLTSNFPFDSSESFIEAELELLSKHFDEIVLVPIQKHSSDKVRKLPVNCRYLSYEFSVSPIQKVVAVFHGIAASVLREIVLLRKRKGFYWTKRRFATLLISYYKAGKIYRFLKHSGLLQPNNVFYSYWCDDAAIALAKLKRKHPEYKAVSRAHGWDVYYEVSEIQYLPLRSFITHRLDAVFPISEKGRSYIFEHWNAPRQARIELMRLGVQPQEFKPAGTGNARKIVSCSNLIPLKRVHLIAEALSLLPDNVAFEWHHFGSGEEFDSISDYAEKYRKPLVSITFHGQVSNAELLDWYRENDVWFFVNVSESEGIPVSVMEAMSFGIPVLATNVGGTGEIVSSENGRLLNPEITGQELSLIFLDLLELSEVEYTSLRKRAHAKCRNDFDVEKNYGKFVEAIKKIT